MPLTGPVYSGEHHKGTIHGCGQEGPLLRISLAFFQLSLFPSAEKVVGLWRHAHLEPVSLLDRIFGTQEPRTS